MRSSRSTRCAAPALLGVLLVLPLACSDSADSTSTTLSAPPATTTSSGPGTDSAAGSGLAPAVGNLCRDVTAQMDSLRSAVSNMSVGDLQNAFSTLSHDLQQVKERATTSAESATDGGATTDELSQAAAAFDEAQQTWQNALGSLLDGNLDAARQQAQAGLDGLNAARQQAADAGIDSCRSGTDSTTTTG